jgi:hypothetical protein
MRRNSRPHSLPSPHLHFFQGLPAWPDVRVPISDSDFRSYTLFTHSGFRSCTILPRLRPSSSGLGKATRGVLVIEFTPSRIIFSQQQPVDRIAYSIYVVLLQSSVVIRVTSSGLKVSRSSVSVTCDWASVEGEGPMALLLWLWPLTPDSDPPGR